MSVENDRCPECEGEGFKEDGYHPDFGVDCEKCEGTGLSKARAGVTCTALVGALVNRWERKLMEMCGPSRDAMECGKVLQLKECLDELRAEMEGAPTSVMNKPSSD